ncbi:50S ribosomal protein L25/general stress protein Ctc [Bosea caraganae]|uniref:Large ribosomal subunit protein bL25 n=1 Tax=Bosea caraganae TaxID=2763117 RepID=A0A370L7M9_9HYPH|nr:50S ribosomal protein L25/general stress protein Ctc [Bosea caraganae]RDJ25318.1 50S ribosomal protein L25/general stress protein Ctc [Bosea caraganae]RDJ25897.1 50S ribosomal protein L25/general stress protein Ctc [Bosea caraganae]
MTAAKQIQASARAQVGKGAARAVRRQGLTPAVIYGGGAAPEAIALNANQTRLLIYAGHFLTTIFEVDVEGKKTRVIPRDYQLDPVKDFPIHVDFLRLAAGQTVKVLVPIHVVGQADCPGLKAGGAMQLVEHAVEIDVSPESIPDAFEVSVAGLEIGDSIHSDALKLPEGASLTSRENLTLVTIVPPNVVEDAPAAEAAPAADAKKA